MLARCKGVRQQRGASNRANSRRGAGVGESISGLFGSLGGPPYPPPPARPPLTRVSAAAGLRAGRGAASPSTVVLRAERRSFSFPWHRRARGRCVLCFVEG